MTKPERPTLHQAELSALCGIAEAKVSKIAASRDTILGLTLGDLEEVIREFKYWPAGTRQSAYVGFPVPAWFAWQQGLSAEAEILATGFVDARRRVLGNENEETLAREAMLALVLQYQGKYEAAEEINRRALEGSEKVLGKEHPDTLTSVSNLASVLQDQGKDETAEAIHRRTLAGYEKVPEKEHPERLISVHYLA
ncbi:hypothetical protein B0A55_09572 [Friedmanniomyces simplex]|uniref:Uncharacterized protein n=1 Tax=Friedmanniomyces simplex TaxID=329884 RepID=A0A4U0X120_9PEZI|nr:hypothetical protein B0A55_09572 [Friedmanniomyces simplex]